MAHKLSHLPRLPEDFKESVLAGRACPIRFVVLEPSKIDLTVESVATALKNEIGSRKTLVFAQDVASAGLLCDTLRSYGLEADTVDSRTPVPKWFDVVERLRTGSLQVLIGGSALLMSGINAPEVSCVVLLRRTKSQAEYTQMVGRGVRLCPGKTDCLIVDFTSVV